MEQLNLLDIAKAEENAECNKFHASRVIFPTTYLEDYSSTQHTDTAL